MSREAELAQRLRRSASRGRGVARSERRVCRWDLDRERTDTCASPPLCRRPICRWANLETSRLWPARTEFQSRDRKLELFGQAACGKFFSKTCRSPSLKVSLTFCWKTRWRAFSCWMQCWRDSLRWWNLRWNCSIRLSWAHSWLMRRCRKRAYSTRFCSEKYCWPEKSCWEVSCSSQALWPDRNSPAHPAPLTTKSAEPGVPGAGFS